MYISILKEKLALYKYVCALNIDYSLIILIYVNLKKMY